MDSIFIVIAQIAASNSTYFLFLSWLSSIIFPLLISFKVMTYIAVILTSIINLFSSKLYMFSSVIRYFSRANVNCIKLISISYYYLIIYIPTHKITGSKAHTLLFSVNYLYCVNTTSLSVLSDVV